AEAYRNDIIPRARGEAERMVQEAQGYRDSQEARARGEAQRFTSVLSSYSAAPDITRRRIYIETMEDILRRNPKIVVDDRLQGLVPLLNLNDPARAGNGARAVPPAAAAGGAATPPAYSTARPQGATR
ncbi:MAG: protease modulator HflK, partial [Paracraurococcus sp.]